MTIHLLAAKRVELAKIFANFRQIVSAILLKFANILSQFPLFSHEQMNCQQTLVSHVMRLFAEKHGNSALSSRVLRFLQDVAIQKNADWIATPCKKTQGSQ